MGGYLIGEHSAGPIEHADCPVSQSNAGRRADIYGKRERQRCKRGGGPGIGHVSRHPRNECPLATRDHEAGAKLARDRTVGGTNCAANWRECGT